jgi:hypothetical protein
MSEKPIYSIDDTRSAHSHSGLLRNIIVHPYGRGSYNAGETADQMAARLLAELTVVNATPHQSRSKKPN